MQKPKAITRREVGHIRGKSAGEAVEKEELHMMYTTGYFQHHFFVGFTGDVLKQKLMCVDVCM